MTAMQINDDSDIGSVTITDLELVDLPNNHDKFYHLYLLSDQPTQGATERFHVFTHYGRNGSIGQTDIKHFTHPFDAAQLYELKISEKINKGYVQIGARRTSRPIPPHILDRAHITPAFDRNHFQTPFDLLRTQINAAIVFASGTDPQFNTALTSLTDMRDKVTAYGRELEEMRGQLEVVEMLVMRRLSKEGHE